MEYKIKTPVFDFLRTNNHIGAANAISASLLASQFGGNTRFLRHLISYERDAGKIILSGSDGYFLAGDKSEVLRYYHTMRKRALHSFQMIKACRKILNEIDGQMWMGDFDNG